MKNIYYVYRLDKNKDEDDHHDVVRVRAENKNEVKDKLNSWRVNISPSWNLYNIKTFEEANEEGKLPKNGYCAKL